MIRSLSGLRIFYELCKFIESVLITGVLTSPNFPNDYPNNLDKSYTIKVEQGLTLELEFTKFRVAFEDYSDNGRYRIKCSSADLTITDGNGITLMDRDGTSGRFGCGWHVTNDPIMIVESNVVNLHFHTGGSQVWSSPWHANEKSGWSFKWKAVFSSGVLTSPNFPDWSPNDFEQNYTIVAEQGQILSLSFTSFKIDDYVEYERDQYGSYDYSSPICTTSHLTITDNDGTPLMEEFCGWGNTPKLIESRTNVVEVHFTNGVGKQASWTLAWRAVSPGQKHFHHPTSRSFLLHQSQCSFIGRNFRNFRNFRKQMEMEMEEGSARVSWYERQLLVGPNHIFHRLLMEGRKSCERLRELLVFSTNLVYKRFLSNVSQVKF